MFLKYLSKQLPVIPLMVGEKRPIISGWQQYCDRLPTLSEAQAWEKGNFGYGLALGSASGLIALDIDSDDPFILNACKHSPVAKRGRKGETRFFRYSASVESTKVAGCIDVLSRGRQTVLPPSIHPDTKQPYTWTTPQTLENFDLSALPVFDKEDLAQMRAVLEKTPQTNNQYSASGNCTNWRAATKGVIQSGARNGTLASIVGGLLRCGLHPSIVFEFVNFLNERKFQPPLETHEIESVMVSIMKREYTRRFGSKS